MADARKKTDRWHWVMRILGVIGVADSLYLTIDALNPSIPLVCPNTGPIDCGKVVSSGYGEIHGFPIAIGAMAWFAFFLAMSFTRHSSRTYIMLPVWLIGMVTIGYLVSVELFIVHAICPYCTLAHVSALVMGVPVLKVTFSEDG